MQHYGEDRRLKDLRTTVCRRRLPGSALLLLGEFLTTLKNSIAQKEFEKAIALLEAALGEYSGETRIARALQAARQELAAKRRVEAIVALCEEAQAYVERRDFASALKLIDQGEKDHGSDAGLSATREKVLAAKTAWERAEAVRQATGEAQKLVAQQDFNKAISLLESSLRRFPGEAALTQELASTRNALQAKRRNDAIDSLCAQAQGLLEKCDFLRALKALEQGKRITAAILGCQPRERRFSRRKALGNALRPSARRSKMPILGLSNKSPVSP